MMPDASGTTLAAISWPVSVLVDSTMHAPGRAARRAATIGAAAVTSPTDTAWIQIRGEPFMAARRAGGITPNLGPMLRRYLPVRSIRPP